MHHRHRLQPSGIGTHSLNSSLSEYLNHHHLVLGRCQPTSATLKHRHLSDTDGNGLTLSGDEDGLLVDIDAGPDS